MSTHFLLHDKHGTLIACVGVMPDPRSVELAAEIRGLKDDWRSSVELAMEIMENFIGTMTPPYLILVGHDETYFWRDPARNRRPVGSVATASLLKSYLRNDDGATPLQQLTSSGLEALALLWLGDVTRASDVPELLRAIGFIEAVRDGTVEIAFAA